MNRWYGTSGAALAAATCILFPLTATAELAFAGAGAQQCNYVNANAIPGRWSAGSLRFHTCHGSASLGSEVCPVALADLGAMSFSSISF
jgi:hypothetical protein